MNQQKHIRLPADVLTQLQERANNSPVFAGNISALIRSYIVRGLRADEQAAEKSRHLQDDFEAVKCETQ